MDELASTPVILRVREQLPDGAWEVVGTAPIYWEDGAFMDVLEWERRDYADRMRLIDVALEQAGMESRALGVGKWIEIGKGESDHG